MKEYRIQVACKRTNPKMSQQKKTAQSYKTQIQTTTFAARCINANTVFFFLDEKHIKVNTYKIQKGINTCCQVVSTGGCLRASLASKSRTP